MMDKLLQSVLGVALIAVGAYGWVVLPNRSEWVALVMIALGGHFVSQSLMAGALKGALTFVRGWWGKGAAG